MTDHNYTLLTNLESYASNKAFDFKCVNGHITTLSIVAYHSRKDRARKYNKEVWLCDPCKPRVAKVDYVNLGKRKFDNYCQYLDLNNYKVKSTFEEFTNNIISFECDKGHITTITVKYFGVRKFSRVVVDDPRLLCGYCNVKGEVLSDKLEKLQISVKDKTNHKILSLDRGKKVTYECGNYGHTSQTSSHNFTNTGKDPRYCSNCAQDNYNQTCFLRKPFTYPSGRVDYVLGYEPFALMELLNHYKEEEIITDSKVIPTFYYDKISRKTGKEYKGRYYPDIMLPDKIIEVKSKFTFNLDKENNIRKMNSLVEQGRKFEFWIYDGKGSLKILRKEDF